MTKALIAFGANLGDVSAHLAEAKERISSDPKIELIATANPLITAAVSGKHEEANSVNLADLTAEYLNTVFLVETQFSAEELFRFTCRTENEMGRQRKKRWGPRTVDLDIILFGQKIIDQPQLSVPHRRMSFRKFVIDPAVEVAADFVDPISGVSLMCLSERLHQSPRRVLWLTQNQMAAEAVLEPIRKSKTGGWEFEIVTGLDAVKTPLENFRLLIYSAADISFPDAAGKFAGPWLSLEGIPSSESATEILGAMQAME